MILEPRQRVLLRSFWREKRLSRSALHERTGMRLNTIGEETAALLEKGILRECDVQAAGRGRPRVPLEIDPATRHILGIAIQPGRVEVQRINLLGETVDEATITRGRISARIIDIAAEQLAQRLSPDTLAIGLTTPGFIDPLTQRMLFSSAVPGGRAASLQPIYDVAGDVPVALENDAHALAAHWALMHPEIESQDQLIVFVDDGQLGASLLIDGKPNQGCVNGANELGHTHLPVVTPPCYCGHTGCLERICSSEFIAQRLGLEPEKVNLFEYAANYDGSEGPVRELIDLLGLGLANAVNFTRVRRLVLVSKLANCETFAQALVRAIEHHTLRQLARRMEIQLWDHPASQQAQTAGCLVLAHLYCEGWNSLLTVGGEVQSAV